MCMFDMHANANANVMHGAKEKKKSAWGSNSGRERIAVSILECSVGNDPSAGTGEPPKINRPFLKS